VTFLSIVTVVRNDPDGLERTARSIYDQGADVEWIVIDGASTDGTLDRLAGLTPNVLVSEPDRGIYDAMNKGMRNATAEWITFLNAGDTYCESTTLARVREWLGETTLPWGFGAVRNIDSTGRAMGIQCASPFTTLGLAFGNTTVPHQATFLRRDFALSLGEFLIDGGTAADQEFLLRAARRYPPAELVWPLVDFRVGGRGMTGGPLHFPTSMRRYRRHASITVTGSPILDAAVDAYTTIKKSLGAAEDRVTRRLSGSPERDS
jgi:glycosyltransferase involved in cell wall biosynthesis